tara:strand:- start:1910 stop:2287 length:378 start_codon:yes stop_codon:yes gene_type:complete
MDEAFSYLAWLEERFLIIDRTTNSLENVLLTMEGLKSKSRSNGYSAIDAKMKKAEEDEKRLRSDLEETIKAINDEQIIIRDIKLGLVDFPFLWGEREVFLCWKKGEHSIQFWHNTDEGFASRKRI